MTPIISLKTTLEKFYKKTTAFIRSTPMRKIT